MKNDLKSAKTDFGSLLQSTKNEETKKRKHASVIHAAGHHDSTNYLKFLKKQKPNDHFPALSKKAEND